MSEDEAWELMRQAWHAYTKKNYDRALRLVHQVAADYPEGFLAISPHPKTVRSPEEGFRDDFDRLDYELAIEAARERDELYRLDSDSFLAVIYFHGKKDYKRASYYAEKVIKRIPGADAQIVLLERCRAALQKRGEAPSNPLVIANRRYVKCSPPPQQKSEEAGAILVALRDAAAAARWKVAFDAESKAVVLKGANGEATLKANSAEATVNGKTVQLAAAPKVVDGHLMVPLNFLTEHLGAKVNWDPQTKIAMVNLPAAPANQPKPQR